MVYALALLITLFASFSAQAATTFFFSSSGNDMGNNCQNQASPCEGAAKMNSVFSSLMAGDQVLFKRGDTLNLSTLLIINGREGMQERPITIGAYGTGDRPILARPNPGSDGFQIFRVDNSSWIIIQDIEFFGGKGAADFRGSAHSTFQRNKMTTCNAPRGGGCVHVGEHNNNPSSFIYILNNEFLNTVAAERIYIGVDPSKASAPDESHDIFILNNKFTGNGSSTQHECIEMKAGSQRVTIRGNYFLNPGTLSQNGCIFSALGSTGYAVGDHIIEDNWIEGVAGTKGYAIRIRNNATIRRNIVIGSSQHGIFLDQPEGDPTYQRTVEYNTAYNNTLVGIRVAGGGTTKANNIEWANGSGNDASDPRFENAGTGNFRLQAGSLSLGKGAVRHVTVDSVTVQQVGHSVLVATTPPVAPLQTCTAVASNFTWRLTRAGVQTGQTCTIDTNTRALLRLGTTIAQGDTGTFSLAATTLFDSTCIGGTLGPCLNGTNVQIDALAISNDSIQGGGTAENLLTLANHEDDSDNWFNQDRTWTKLLGDSSANEQDSAYSQQSTTFVEWCFDALTDVGNVEIRGDDDDNAICDSVDIGYRTTVGGALTKIINDGDCTFNRTIILSFNINTHGVKCLRFDFVGTASGTQIFRTSAFGTPQTLPSPGALPLEMVETPSGGCLGACP
jgi:hypothetical protein